MVQRILDQRYELEELIGGGGMAAHGLLKHFTG